MWETLNMNYITKMFYKKILYWHTKHVLIKTDSDLMTVKGWLEIK